MLEILNPFRSVPPWRLAWVTAVALLAPHGRAGGAETTENRRVLVLFSNDRLLPANQRLDAGIRQVLDPGVNEAGVTLFAEFLDAIRFAGEERERAMEEYLERRYRDKPPHVLVAIGPQALGFFLARRDGLFRGVPLVFGGVGREDAEQIQGLPGVAGIPMELTVVPAVEALIAMRPQMREIVLVHGSSEFDRSWRETALRQCEPFADRLKITAFPELPLAELTARLGGLSEEKAVLYLSYFQGPGGDTHTPARVASEIAAASAVPVMGPYDTYLGSGILGVGASVFEEDGVALGHLIRRVLAGEAPAAIGILPPRPARLILDDRQVRRWGIKSVPAEAEHRFRRPSVWEQYPAGVIATITVLVLQGLLIAGLFLARARQKRAERELRLSEERFSGIFHGSPAAISILRQSDGRIVDVNPGWESTTGIPRSEAIGRTPLETGMIIDGDGEERLRQFLESGKSLHDYEQAHRRPDGSVRVLSLSVEPLALRGEPCYIVVAKDVTSLREKEHARDELARTSRLAMLGEMTASIAHEINQPLGAILSNTAAAELLLARPAPPLGEVRQILSDIRRDDVRASAVISRVRALVGRAETVRVPTELNAVLLEALRLVAHEAQRRGVTLVSQLADGLPEIPADPVQLEQVALNLLLNAMDAMEDTPVAERRIVVRSAPRNGGSVEASMEDCGHGIPSSRLDRVFDSFFTTKEGGLGLGLALARSIIEAHGGSLHAENNPSLGATFRLILPVNTSPSHDLHAH